MCVATELRAFFLVMARLDRAIHEDPMADKGGWVYVMTNKPRGTLYVGVTAELSRRVYEHREGVSDGVTKRYELKLLVYAERHDSIESAIQRAKRESRNGHVPGRSS
jgi:putative endonuclease